MMRVYTKIKFHRKWKGVYLKLVYYPCGNTLFFDVWELPKEITGTTKVHSLMVPYSVLYEGGIDVGPASI